MNPEVSKPSEMTQAVARLVESVAQAGLMLDLEGLRAAFDLYAASQSSSEAETALAALAPEYRHVESLLILDSQGGAAPADQAMLSALTDWTARQPGFQSWVWASGPRLLASRWLCHLAGLRHATVELFIDHPTQPDLTLLQVRGYTKTTAPGCFDLPVAGHVDGLLSNLDGLRKECREELGLDLDATGGDVVYLGCVESGAVESGALLKNTELHFIYRVKPSTGVWLSLRPDPDEVAGLAVFSIDSLKDALSRDEKSPRQRRRFASGIREAFPLYLEFVD